MNVKSLVGGDVIRLEGSPKHAVFIGASPHPDYEQLALVVWRLSDGTYSFDALDWNQEVGFLTSYRNNNVNKLKETLT